MHAEAPPTNPRIEAVEANDIPLCVFRVRDIQYTEDWVSADDDNDETPMMPRILTITGWAFRDDGNYTHIAQLWDPTSRCFGGGVIVPNDNIMETSRLGDME